MEVYEGGGGGLTQLFDWYSFFIIIIQMGVFQDLVAFISNF